MNLKQKTISGLTWSFIDNFARLGTRFLIGIILARLLSPKEFGLIGMTIIFTAISEAFIDGGFTQALIRKQNCTQTDYSTVFFFNLVISIVFYIILFLSAFLISGFFNEPKLTLIIRVLALGLIINALSIVQNAILIKDINFKLQTKISIITITISGIIGIWLAYIGLGIWALVIQTILSNSLTTMLLWFFNKWKPTYEFSPESFKEMFSFGSKLLASRLIDTIYTNIYLLIIGKFFSAADLGYYTRADQFKSLPSQNITGVIQRVSYPVLATIQDDKVRMKDAYKKLIRSTMLITFVLMFALVATAEPLINTLIGSKWQPSVIYLQLLCFVGMFYPLSAINLNILQIQGKSELFLKLELVKKILAIPTIIIGIIYGIKIMILGMIAYTIIAYYLNSYWSGKFIGYSMAEQIKDILPSFLLGLIIGVILFLIGIILPLSFLLLLIIQCLAGIILFIIISEMLKLSDYIYLKRIIFEKLRLV